jgi:putative transposase
MPLDFTRKNIRLPLKNYRGKGSYFVTLCFHRRWRLGTNPRLARWLIKDLEEQASACSFLVHAYCIMPDHIHFLAEGATAESDLTQFVIAFKQGTAFQFTGRTELPLWQFKYYDHILRRAEGAEKVAWYIWMNPVRQGLCRLPQEFPFSGSFTELGARLFRSQPILGWIPPWKCSATLKGGTQGSGNEPKKDAALKRGAT